MKESTDKPGSLATSVEALLDHALASYTPSTPRQGLEDRVRARLAASAEASQRRPQDAFSWLWIAAASLASAALFLGIALRPHALPAHAFPGRNESARVVISPRPVNPRVAGPGSVHSTRPPRRTPLHEAKILPPSPHRLSEQQVLIAELLANAPEAVASLARTAAEQDKPIAIQPLPADPLVIEPIRIAPLEDNPAHPGDSH